MITREQRIAAMQRIGDFSPVKAANVDLANPYVGLSDDPDATATVQTPPTDDETVQHIAEILLAGYLMAKTVGLLHALIPSISSDVWTAVIDSTGPVSAAAPLSAHDLAPSSIGATVARSAARREAFYRAAYIARAGERVQAEVNDGEGIVTALKSQVPTLRQHIAARTNRLHAAAVVGQQANRFGLLLGWYLDPLLNNEPECIAANGHNFYADQSTVIGDPGAVHLFCGCKAGPPIPGAGMVNDEIAKSHAVIFSSPRKYGLKTAKAS